MSDVENADKKKIGKRKSVAKAGSGKSSAIKKVINIDDILESEVEGFRKFIVSQILPSPAKDSFVEMIVSDFKTVKAAELQSENGVILASKENKKGETVRNPKYIAYQQAKKNLFANMKLMNIKLNVQSDGVDVEEPL